MLSDRGPVTSHLDLIAGSPSQPLADRLASDILPTHFPSNPLRLSLLPLVDLRTYLTSPRHFRAHPTKMGTKWTADRDQKLFLLLVDQIKVDGNALSTAWKAKYSK